MSPIVKRKPEKPKIPGKYVMLMLSMLCIALMLTTFTTNITGTFLGNIAGFIIVPFQKGITSISTVLVEASREKETIAELQAENQALQEQINELQIENTLLMQDKYELTGLRELYELDQQYSEYEKVGARVISASSGNWFDSFIIDKGSDDGILVDMNVIAGSGLVGRIVETGKNWARVTTVINNNSNISASVLHTQDNLIVSGDLRLIENGFIRYSQLIDEDNQVGIGDKVVTSNISDKYLPGILLGYVASVETDSNNLTKSGYITPVVDFEHLSEVLVIIQMKPEFE